MLLYHTLDDLYPRPGIIGDLFFEVFIGDRIDFVFSIALFTIDVIGFVADSAEGMLYKEFFTELLICSEMDGPEPEKIC